MRWFSSTTFLKATFSSAVPSKNDSWMITKVFVDLHYRASALRFEPSCYRFFGAGKEPL